MATELRVQVTASPAPIPLDFLIKWLKAKAARGVKIEISPVLARRIAAELEEKRA